MDRILKHISNANYPAPGFRLVRIGLFQALLPSLYSLFEPLWALSSHSALNYARDNHLKAGQ